VVGVAPAFVVADDPDVPLAIHEPCPIGADGLGRIC
jgi:hypothetical protein